METAFSYLTCELQLTSVDTNAHLSVCPSRRPTPAAARSEHCTNGKDGLALAPNSVIELTVHCTVVGLGYSVVWQLTARAWTELR